MSSTPNQPRRRPRFTIRSGLVLMLLVAVLLGWRSSAQPAKLQLTQQAKQLRYFEQELERARDELDDPDRPRRVEPRVLREGSPGNAFQRAPFKDCNLENATLRGGDCAFQFAQFDNSNLASAKLTGGAASFQGSSFENATLVGARLVGCFQLVNISGARFEGADLSTLDCESLESCYFKKPPAYNRQTQFPDGFDPEKQQWRRVAD